MEKEIKEVKEVEVKQKGGAIKKICGSIKSGASWCWDKRHFFLGGAFAALFVYVKGYFAGCRSEREWRDRRNEDEMAFMKALVGYETGLTEEKIEQAQAIKDTLEHTELDMDKLNQIYENWSQDDWEEFVSEKYGL